MLAEHAARTAALNDEHLQATASLKDSMRAQVQSELKQEEQGSQQQAQYEIANARLQAQQDLQGELEAERKRGFEKLEQQMTTNQFLGHQ